MDKPLNVLFKGDVLKIIKRIQRNSGVKNRAEVVRDALALYDEVDKFNAKNKGGLIMLQIGKRVSSIRIPRKSK